MDERIGAVVNHINELGIRDDTIIIFQSDHGHSVEERTFGGGGNPGRYRGCKGCLFEGGIRVPSIVSWPENLPQREVRDQMAVGCDWLPTIAELTESELPNNLDGKSIVGIIKSSEAESPHQSFYWQLGKGNRAQWVVRKGDWKLLGNPQDRRAPKSISDDDRLFLANLASDPTESKNLASQHPQIVDELASMQHNFANSINRSTD